ncbi:uncharacterized protein FA14DRAFT_173382 [Meira miltonrushii]|uniref:Uncharacterized protein n=1 Tax=Meira miltonrushii TaxID=1280837 RepID=A0A316VDP0_9BASI|nr:uncharacterized protein FA14DRAFT_173382 [Meira miltonrushii]PWN33605.1 hypothetical protein FA14DRAFT_173382 [Meira miltonrushii]
MSGNVPPLLANQRRVSDNMMNNRSITQRSVSDERVPTNGTQGRSSSSSNRNSTLGSLFRTRVDQQPQRSSQQSQRPTSQNQHRPASAYYPSHHAAPAYTQSSPISGLPATSDSYSSTIPGLPAPMPNPYQSGYNQTQYRPPQSAPNQQHAFNAYPHPPTSAPATYGSQQQQYNGSYSSPQQPPHNSGRVSSPSIPQASAGQAEGDSDYEAVLQASRASAAEEERKREQREKEEEEHYMALYRSEEEERRKRQEEEEERSLMEAMRASQIEDEELRRKRLERQREEEEAATILIEESRQSALREEEERMRRQHAELLEQSRREAEQAELSRRHALAEQERLEQAAVEESLRELEEEWRRRDEAERADAMHIQRGGEIGDVSYWQHLDEKKAHRLALEMNERFAINGGQAAGPSNSNVGASSNNRHSTVRSRRRPLPPTPSMAAQAAGVEVPRILVVDEEGRTTDKRDYVDDDWELSDDEFMAGDGQIQEDGSDPFGDQAEAPPMYDEVHSDRPPEAPTSIPTNVQFVRPDFGPRPDHDNTISTLSYPVDKSAAYSSTVPGSRSTSQSPPAQSSNLPIASTSSQAAHNALPSTSHGSPSQPAASSSRPVSGAPGKRLPDIPIDRPPIPVARIYTDQQETVSLNRSQSQSTQPTEDSNRPSEEPESVPTTPDEAVNFQQKQMKGTDFGYSGEPFGTSLYIQGLSEAKTTFPNIITLSKCKTDGSLTDENCFFVVRAPSWKALVRALAWYGNTRIEAGPEEIVDYPEGVPLRIEIEFVTPSKVNKPNESQLQKAHVSVCFSLAIPSLKEAPPMPLLKALKDSSRALDSGYLRQGATRRVIALPSQPPKLPLDVVRLAQHMHRAHTFSAACPSTGATALHSPRDLHHAVERHDVGYVAKLQRKRKDNGLTGATVPSASEAQNASDSSMNNTATGGNTGQSSSSNQPTSDGARRQSKILQPSSSSIMNQSGGTSTNAIEEESLEGELNHTEEHGDFLDAGAVEIVDGDDRDSGRMARLRARVHRRLGKRSGDPRTVDQDLESWITPYDMTQHG